MQRASKGQWIILLAVLLLPLVPMAIIPFYDTSEPRYAEIARVMAQSGDWITPWFKPGLPFWGKPPLSFWAQALSMKILGVNEFAARFPSWLCMILSNGILLAGLRPLYGMRVACLSAIIYSTSALVYLSSGAVLTDPFLALGTTLSLISYAVAVHGRIQCMTSAGVACENTSHTQPARASIWWQYGFFLGLAIGLLSKGPLAIVLISAPIIVWHALNRKKVSPAATLSWAKGLALMMAISLPWYILAELKTPGFWDYFIIGEHVRRFLDPGWAGDLYGSAHRRPYGTIWFYWLQASFPWGIAVLTILFAMLFDTRLRAAVQSIKSTPLLSYWLAAALFTPIFFTFSANILWTYVLPSLAGLSVLAAILIEKIHTRQRLSRRLLLTTISIVPIAILGLSVVAWSNPNLRNTERGLLRYTSRDESLPLKYLTEPPFSALFYSAGKAQKIEMTGLGHAIECAPPFYLAIPKDKAPEVENISSTPLKALYSNKRYILVKISPPSGCQGAPAANAAAASPNSDIPVR